MKNLWVSQNEPFATWNIKLTIKRNEPELLLQWYQKVLRAGEMTEVYKVRKASQPNYCWPQDGFIGDHLIRQYQDTGVLDLFDFATGGRDKSATILARVASFGWQGQFLETDEEDLGEALASLRPEDNTKANEYYMRSCNGVTIHWGELIDFRDPTAPIWTFPKDNLEVQLKLYSDIWFPWVYGFMEDEYEHAEHFRFSNHELAGRHTPRLNEFLHSVREATLAMGGTWELGREPEETHRTLLFMVDEDGIHLNAKLPPGTTESFLLDPNF